MRDDEDRLLSENFNKWKKKEVKIVEGWNSRRRNEEITNKNKWEMKKKK